MDTISAKSAKRLNGVDAMKFIMAFAVVIIHIQSTFKVEYSASINWFIRLAVPYFFIASGFLTACRFNNLDSLSDKSKYLKRKALRFGKMFLLWLLIYMPISLVAFDYSNISALSKDIVWYVSNVILNGESKFAWPLWYLYSSMIAYFILCVSVCRRRGKIAALLLAAFVIAGLIVLPYLDMTKTVEFGAKGIFTRFLGGFPYILTGFILHKYIDRVSGAMVVFILLLLSCTAFYYDIEIFPLLGGMALFLISYMVVLPDKGLYSNLNTIGIWIYLTHMFILLIIIHTGISMDKYVLLSITFVVAFTTALAINQLSKIKGFVWLKNLI